MIQFDRFTKIILTVIALLLLALFLRGNMAGVQSTANAQTNTSVTPPQVRLVHIQDIPVKNFQEVILLGDGKTFLIRVDAGIGVYQVQNY